MLLQIVGDRVAMGPDNTAWHWMGGAWRFHCYCGRWVAGVWLEATSHEARCPGCVQVRPFVVSGSEAGGR